MATVVEPETETTTCLICDGDGTLCERCSRPKQRCECDGGCDRTVVCEDCGGEGTKLAAPSAWDETCARSQESVSGEADLRDDEPMPAWKVELVAKIQAVEAETQDAERVYLECKEAAKEAKDRLDSRIADLRSLIRRLDKAEEPMPLLDSLDKPAATNGQPANEKWRTDPIDALQAHGLTESIVAKLREKSLETLGDLADFQAKHGDFWAKEIKGLGPTKAAKVADAQAGYWAAHPEHCVEPVA